MGGHGILYPPTWKKGGTRLPCPPPNWAHVTNHDFGPDTKYTSPNCTDRPQVNIHCIEHFFIVHDSWATCACPEKTELPWIFLLYWIYFLHSGFLTSCACPENRVSPEIFHCIEYTFYIQEFWATCMRLPWKTGCPEFTVLIIYFLSFRIFEQLALSLKNGMALEFFTVLKYFLSFWIFEQLVLAVKNRGFPEFTVPNIYFLLFRSFE